MRPVLKKWPGGFRALPAWPSAAGTRGKAGTGDTARPADSPEKPLQADRIAPLRLSSVSACALAAHVRVLAVSIAVSTRGKCLPRQRLARRYPSLSLSNIGFGGDYQPWRKTRFESLREAPMESCTHEITTSRNL